MEMDTISWEEPLAHRMKIERNLNFSTISNEEDEFGFSRKKTARDPMSHRIIEKRRRDRMNNCLADLSRLVPTNYLKKGRGRIEKTEIIEMAIKHLKHLQAHPCKDPANCEVAKTTELDHKRQYRLGYQECMSETVRFMVESEGLFSGDGVCVRLINHLQKHYDKVAGGMCYTQALGMMVTDDTKPTLHVDMEGNSVSGFPSDTCSDSTLTSDRLSYQFDSRASDVISVPPPELKQEEVDCQLTNQQDPVPKVTSQLREMLQNPGLPKERSRVAPSLSPQPMPSRPDSHQSKAEEVYKFKNNIKHRFNADLRHHNSSPTDSHASLQDDDNKEGQGHPRSPHFAREDRGNYPMVHHELIDSARKDGPPRSPEDRSTYSTVHHELMDTARSHHPHWDSHETGSSCGSNPSPPPATNRSNGSSSGYSTNGESKTTKPSPVTSPYSQTPDRLSNRSPSPPPGVPIFALHPKGTFYIPLTIEGSLLTPYLTGVDDLAPVLHPVSICVNFSVCSAAVKVTAGAFRHHQQGPPSSYLMDKFHQDRYYTEGNPGFYPYSPMRNGCS